MPLNVALKAFTLALNDSADALMLLLPVVKEVQDRFIMRFYGSGNGFKRVNSGVFYIVMPDSQSFESLLLVFADGEDLS